MGRNVSAQAYSTSSYPGGATMRLRLVRRAMETKRAAPSLRTSNRSNLNRPSILNWTHSGAGRGSKSAGFGEDWRIGEQ